MFKGKRANDPFVVYRLKINDHEIDDTFYQLLEGMQPSFLGKKKRNRFITIAALLISVIYENAYAKEKEEEIREIRNEEYYEELSNDKNSNVDKILFDSSSSNTDKLAQKFANDALTSLKIQKTIHELANIDSSRNDLNKALQQPAREYPVQKSKIQSTRPQSIRHEDRKEKKRKRHKHRYRRKRLKNRRPRWSKKSPAKVDYDYRKKQNAVKLKIHVRKPSSNLKEKKNEMIHEDIAKGNEFMIDNATLINWNNLNVEDYIDLTRSTHSKIDARTMSMKPDKTETMTEDSMSTITAKNLKKKNRNDQEQERKLKEKRKSPRARSIRQSFTVSPSNRNSNDYLYIPNENIENNPDFKHLDDNENNSENHFSNSISLTSVQSALPNELEPTKSFDSMILPMGREKHLHPARINENFVTGVSNFAFPKSGQNERSRPLLVGPENSVNADTNPVILHSNGHQYSLPLENDNINLYTNYMLNTGPEDKAELPVEDNVKYLHNYDTYLDKQDEKYIHPVVHNLPENQLKDQLRLPEVNKNIENTIELKNPTTFTLPQDQELLRYVPVTYKGDRSLLVNFSNIRNDKTSTNLRGNVNTNLNEPWRKISDISSSHEHVKPVERFPNLLNFKSEETWRKEDDEDNLMNQQIIRRGLQRGFENSGNLKELDESAAETKEILRRKLATPQKNAIARNRYSVEEDVANSQRIDIAATVNETKEVADQILNRIVDELEEIKMGHTKDKNSEGFPCKLSGSWVTSKAGVRIDIQIVNRSIIVTLANLIPQPMHIGLLNTTWNVTGHAPFKRGGPFSLLAYDNRTKTLAVFVGSCRVCQGIDTIEGIWSVAREPRDCRNFQMATEVFNDIFRRTKLLTAIKEKKKSILQSMLMRNLNNVTSHNGVTKNINEQND